MQITPSRARVAIRILQALVAKLEAEAAETRAALLGLQRIAVDEARNKR